MTTADKAATATSRDHIAMIVANPCTTDSRVRKEAFTLAAAGFAVTVICDDDGGAVGSSTERGVRFQRLALAGAKRAAGVAAPTTVPVRKRLRRATIRLADQLSGGLLSVLVRARHRNALAAAGIPALCATGAAIVHAHDLETLPAAAAAAAALGAGLVYDAHELEAGRHGRRWLERIAARRLEQKYVRHAARVITVSESIARVMAEAYSMPLPLVLLNSPDLDARRAVTEDLRANLGLAPPAPLLVYIGKIGRHRGLEAAIDALPMLAGFHLACVGPADTVYCEELLRRASGLGVAARFHAVAAVAPEALLDFVASADCSLVLTEDAGLSYRYSMPNKLFESCFAGLPVGVSDLPEQRAFVEQTGTGAVLDTQSPAALAADIRRLYEDRDKYRMEAAAQARLALDYAWAAQAKKLVALANDILAGRH